MGNKKKTDAAEELTEQQKRNRRNYAPEPLIGICPACKRFHRDQRNCATITAFILAEEKRKRW